MNKPLLALAVFVFFAFFLAPVLISAEDASATPSLEASALPSPEASVESSVEPSVVPSASPSIAPSASPAASPEASPSATASVSASLEPSRRGFGKVKQQARDAAEDVLKGARGLVRAKWFKWRFVWAHATGIAVTDSAGEYHAFSIHGRVLRYIPYVLNDSAYDAT